MPSHEISAAPDYFVSVGEVALQIEKAADTAAVVELLEEACRRLGADVATFLSFMQDDGSFPSFRFLLACDPCWCAEYEAQAWYADDPWLNYARSHSAPIRAAHIVPRDDTQRAIVHLAVRFGFVSAIIIPVPSGGGLSRTGMLCLGSRNAGHFDGEDFPRFKLAAQLLATALHDWVIAMLRRELLESCALTPDDLALLDFESRGYGSKQIASSLDATPGAIDARFLRILAKLSVPSRTAAAQLAAEYGLIAYAPPASPRVRGARSQ
jgi:DNA-binding CsgD family transcriptional regulator